MVGGWVYVVVGGVVVGWVVVVVEDGRTVLSMGGGGGGWHHALGVWGCRDWLTSLAQAPVDSFIESDKGWRGLGTGTERMAGAGVRGLARGYYVGVTVEGRPCRSSGFG